MNIKVCESRNMWTWKQVEMWEYYRQSKYICEPMINKACEYTKHFNIGVGNHQWVQAYEFEGIQASGLVISKVCRHGSILSSRHVNIEACDQQSIWSTKHMNIRACNQKVFRHMSILTHKQVEMFSSKNIHMWHMIIKTCEHRSVCDN